MPKSTNRYVRIDNNEPQGHVRWRRLEIRSLIPINGVRQAGQLTAFTLGGMSIVVEAGNLNLLPKFFCTSKRLEKYGLECIYALTQ